MVYQSQSTPSGLDYLGTPDHSADSTSLQMRHTTPCVVETAGPRGAMAIRPISLVPELETKRLIKLHRAPSDGFVKK